jgi:heparanase 1
MKTRAERSKNTGGGCGVLFWIVVVLAGLITVVGAVGLWGGSGTILDLIAGQSEPQPKNLDPRTSLAPAANSYTAAITVDERSVLAELPPEYLSFTIDASQLVGGKWWNPAAAGTEMGSGTVHAPVFDFSRQRLDALTAALAPAYLRVGGSESDKIYYDLQAEGLTPPRAPGGYQSVLTRSEWDALNAFAAHSHLKLVFTLNAGPGSRKDGAWNPANARALVEYSAQKGYPVAAWELGNELNIFWFVHGFAAQVPVAQYAKDLQAARELANLTPGARLGGQGSAIWPVLGEPLGMFYGYLPRYLQEIGGLPAAERLIDLISWHYYPQQSRRGPVASRRAYPSRLLDPHNLDEAAYWAEKMRAWRDAFAPGKPIWLGETGNAQFGGEPGLSDSYLGGLWWLDELGLMAREGTQVVVRQTLSGMNYGLIEDETLTPRPDYWNSLLWKRLMGRRVHPVIVAGGGGKLRAYAQSDDAGQLTVLAINLDPQNNATLNLPGLHGRACVAYLLNAPDLFGNQVMVNGQTLAVGPDNSFPQISGVSCTETVTLNPLSYGFLVVH